MKQQSTPWHLKTILNVASTIIFNTVKLVLKNVLLDGRMLPLDNQDCFAHRNIVLSLQNTDQYIQMMLRTSVMI